MRCTECDELTMRYLDGEMNDIDFYRLKQHFKECASCEKEYKVLVEITQHLENEPLLEPPENFNVLVMTSLKDQFPKEQILRNKNCHIPVKTMLIFVGAVSFIMAAWIMLFVHYISFAKFPDLLLDAQMPAALFDNLILAVCDFYKIIKVLGSSFLDVYYIFLRNYYDFILAVLIVLLLGFGVLFRRMRER